LRAYSQLVSARGPLTVDVNAQAFRDLGADLRIDPRIEAAAYRITQEAITNVVRHSGASKCTVGLTFNDAVAIEIRDNGHGIPAPQADGVGLTSNRQRAEPCGGALSISTSPAGTCLTVRFPPKPAS
jgi:signal transduction histidine kinase